MESEPPGPQSTNGGNHGLFDVEPTQPIVSDFIAWKTGEGSWTLPIPPRLAVCNSMFLGIKRWQKTNGRRDVGGAMNGAIGWSISPLLGERFRTPKSSKSQRHVRQTKTSLNFRPLAMKKTISFVGYKGGEKKSMVHTAPPVGNQQCERTPGKSPWTWSSLRKKRQVFKHLHTSIHIH